MLEVDARAIDVINTLEAAGYETWLVGGFVRDGLLGRPNHDIDLTTAALWQTTKEICLAAGWAVHETGTQHGTLTVVANGCVIEITTFRTEGEYLDHRRPSEVSFTQSVEEDLARRDFSINAMAYHPERGLFDPFGGKQDLENKIIRCVGVAKARFVEDALRILRAVRFASQLGFTLEPATLKAAIVQREDLHHLANERIETELTKLLCGEYVLPVLLNQTPILNVVLPELIAMEGLDQRNKHHIYDVYEHTAHVVSFTPQDPLTRWAGLLHDAGKPEAFFVGEDGVGHMYGHPKISAKITTQVAKRLRFPKAFAHDLKLLVLYHDVRPGPTKKSIRRLYAKLEGKECLFHAICNLMRADSLAQAPEYHFRVETINELEAIFNEMIAEDEVFSLKNLAISGADLLAAGTPQGRQIGLALNAALEEVIEERLPNDHDILLAFALDFLK